MKIAALSTQDHPMLGYFIKEISKKHKINYLILDSYKRKKKDKKIWNERTCGKLKQGKVNLKKIKIPVIKFKSHLSTRFMTFISKKKISLLINCGTPRILSKKILKAPTIGVLNCHPGILPKYRGCTCTEWALYHNDKIGNTCHLMTSKIDEGPIIYKKILPIKHKKSYQDIRISVYLDAPKCMSQSISKIKLSKYNKKYYPKNGVYWTPINKLKMKKIFQKYGNSFAKQN